MFSEKNHKTFKNNFNNRKKPVIFNSLVRFMTVHFFSYQVPIAYWERSFLEFDICFGIWNLSKDFSA